MPDPEITATGRHASDFSDTALIGKPRTAKAFDGYGDAYVLGDRLLVRIDDRNCPEFWAEARIPLDLIRRLMAEAV